MAFMDDALRALELTTPQYSVLCAIEAGCGISSARLARLAFVTPQTMHGLLTNLAEAALLARDADPEHGRILRTRLTDRGRKVLADARRAVTVIQDRMVTSLGPANSVRMTASLTRCAEYLESMVGTAAESRLGGPSH